MLLFGLVGCRTHDVPLNMLDLNSVEPVKIVVVKITSTDKPHKDGSIYLSAELNNREIVLEGFAPNKRKIKPGNPIEIKEGKVYIVALYGPLKLNFRPAQDTPKKLREQFLRDRYQCLNLYGDRFYPVSEELLYLDDLDLKPLE